MQQPLTLFLVAAEPNKNQHPHGNGSSKNARPSTGSTPIASVEKNETGSHSPADACRGLKKPFVIELNATTTMTIAAPTFDVKSAFSDPSNYGNIIRKGTLDLLFFRKFLIPPVRRQLFRYLLEELPWYRVTYKARGMDIRTPRYTTVFGCDDLASPPTPLDFYDRRPRAIPPVLSALKEEVSRRTGAQYNFVLCNFYADGKDSIAYHSDGEDFLGPNPTIASLTLGASRDFFMRPMPTPAPAPQKALNLQAQVPMEVSHKVDKWTLETGDMVVMRGATQSTWEHSIPKRASAKGRINITFRRAINSKGTNNYYRYNVGDGNVFRYRNGEMIAQSVNQ